MSEKEKINIKNIVPLVAKISAGKSKLLNVLYNINFLECKAGIGTKFINILRYNPNIKQPCFYHLILEREGENYTFYKDKSKIYEGEENIIQANKEINNKLYNENQINYEDIFYMTEINNKPFIDDNYLLTHDLCDIPGLSEYQYNTNNDENNINEKKEKSKKNVDELEQKQFLENEFISEYKTEIKSLNLYENENEEQEIQMEIDKNDEENNNEDDIFNNIKNETEDKTYLTEIFKIIKNYIDGAIIILSVDNYKSKDNYLIIAKLHKVIQKEIQNCLIILNKIDLSENPTNDINECKGLFAKYFPKFKTFNINYNTFIPISVNQLKNELLMDKNFENLIYYHFYNYMSKTNDQKNKDITNKFIDHLKNLIKKYNKKIKKNDIKTQVEEFKDISKMNQNIISIINNIRNTFQDKGLNIGISEQDINSNNDDEDDDEDDDDDNINNLNSSYIIKYFYIIYNNNSEKKKLIPPISEKTNKLLNYFKIHDSRTHFKNQQKTKNEFIETNNKALNNLEKITNNLSTKLKVNIDFLIKDIEDTIKILRISNKVFIPFLGEINSGKSTIINGIIGEDVLPTGLKECTKRGIIIRYCKDEINIRKVSFREKKISDKIEYFFDSKNQGIIAKGLKNVRGVLESLNYAFNEKEEDSFYYIKTKIKLFDDLELDDSLKTKIYLIDLPGFGTENVFENEIYLKLKSICNIFIFTYRNNKIKENNQKIIIDKIFDQTIKAKDNNFVISFLKSCFFLINNDENQTTTEDDKEKAKIQICDLIGSEGDINLCFFNALRYSNYNNNYNYYYNIEKTLENEFKNFLKYNFESFKYPENEKKKYESFCKYILDMVKEKNNFLFGIKKYDNQKNDEEVEKKLTEIFQKYGIEMNNILKYKNKISQAFSFGKEKIKAYETKKESNYDEFKEKLKSQIISYNNNLQEELKRKIDNIIKKLDYFFQMDFSNNKDIKEINYFEDNKEDMNKHINTIFHNIQINFFETIQKYTKDIKDSLNKKKENIKEILKKEGYRKIMKVVYKEIENNLEELSNKIAAIFEKFNSDINEFIMKANKKIKDKIININIEQKEFLEYFKEKIDIKDIDLKKAIYYELEIAGFYSTKIYEEKGFKEWVRSMFSNVHYLSNYIEITLNNFLKNSNDILKVFLKIISDYIKDLFHETENKYKLARITFTKEQAIILKELNEDYEKIKKEIKQINIYIKNN